MDTVVDLNQLKEYAYNAGLALAVAVIIYLFLYLVDYLIKKLNKRLLSLNLKSFRLFGLEVINVGKLKRRLKFCLHILGRKEMVRRALS